MELEGMLTADGRAAEFAETIHGLLDNGQTRIVVNCDHVPYFDSAGIGELVKAYTAVSRRGGALKVIMPPRPIGGWGGLGAVTKVLTIFEGYQTEAEAIASFGDDRS